MQPMHEIMEVAHIGLLQVNLQRHAILLRLTYTSIGCEKA